MDIMLSRFSTFTYLMSLLKKNNNKARVIGVWDSKVDLVDSCLEETGGLGVDVVIDAGGKIHAFCNVMIQTICIV